MGDARSHCKNGHERTPETQSKYGCRTCRSARQRARYTPKAKTYSGYVRGPLAVRFWAKVNKDGPIHPELGTPCFLWIGGTARGYGRIWDIAGEIGEPYRQWQAPRAAYALTRVNLGKGMDFVVRHRCDNSMCVNPDHLEHGTQADNINDAIERGHMNWQRKNLHTKSKHEAST
jgi:hypothetical protein